MEISIGVGSDSISIVVENPFHIDLDSVVGQIEAFCSLKGAALNGVDVRGLIPKMIRVLQGAREDALLMQRSLSTEALRSLALPMLREGFLLQRQ